MVDFSAANLLGGDEFPITAEEFRCFSEFFSQQVGMQFAQSKRYFVDRRLAERARASGCATFAQYFDLVRAAGARREVQELINLLTVNETYFFRESYQLEALVRSALPEIARHKRPGEPIRIWSLPCSTGEEPYSIAMTVLESWPESDRFRIEIMGSDVDTRVLGEAAAGVYGERSLQNVGPERRARYFRRVDAGFEIIPELRTSIDFSRVNLSDRADMAKHRDIDIVFCRNLLIYFDDAARGAAVDAIFETLTAGGFLFLGHTENLNRLPSRFATRHLGECIVYQRPWEAP